MKIIKSCARSFSGLKALLMDTVLFEVVPELAHLLRCNQNFMMLENYQMHVTCPKLMVAQSTWYACTLHYVSVQMWKLSPHIFCNKTSIFGTFSCLGCDIYNFTDFADSSPMVIGREGTDENSWHLFTLKCCD